MSKDITAPAEDGKQSSRFLWNKNSKKLFVKNQTKPKKSVCLSSNHHHSANRDQSNEKRKPDSVAYKCTKVQICVNMSS